MEQYKLDFLFLADAANVDRFGKLNVLGIFKTVNFNRIPGILIKFTIICTISLLNPEKPFKVDIKIKDESGDLVTTKTPLSFPFKPQEGNKDNSVNLLIDMINLKFDSFGKYEVEIFVNETKIGSTFLQVLEKKSK